MKRPLVRHDQHSRARVIENFRSTGRVDTACMLAGVDRTMHYDWLKKFPDYAEQFEAAKRAALDLLIDKAKERALAGESDRLLEFLIKGLDPATFGDRMKTEHSGTLTLQQSMADTIRARRAARIAPASE